MLDKHCDFCGKEILDKKGINAGYSEFVLYHYAKRRDFCCFECFMNWFINYVKEQRKKEDKTGLTVGELVAVLLNENSKDEIILRDEKGNELHNIKFNLREAEKKKEENGGQRTFECLFG